MAADSNSFQFTYSYTLPEELSWVPGEHHSDDIVDAGVHHMARRFLTEALSSSEAIASIEDPTVEWFDPVSEWFDPVSEQPVGTHYYSRAEEDPVFSTDDHHDSLLPFAPPALPALPALNPHNLLQGHLDVDRKDVEMVMVLRDEEDSEVEEEVDGCLVEDADVESPRYDSSVEETASLSLSESVSPAVSLCTRLDCGDAAGTAATTPEVEEPLEEAPSGKLPDVVAHTSSGTTYHLRSRMKRSYVGDDDIASGDDVQPGPSSRPASLPARAGKRRRLGDDDEWAPAVEKTKTKEPKGKGKGKANGTVRKSETNGEVSQEQASPPAKNVTSEGRNAGSIYVRLRDVGRLVYPPAMSRRRWPSMALT
ncbi:hypothetical protein L226DRAFT_609826 [Lentinus tigrinus ALCF2SS1-7]|uniref:uncharacterized protein n=1 Tax=Lentinus tigrinus ALCF2SS1-7 TaxID=1328758 RepID=UPI001166250E|nr:hypothetical protein L226DRAFT_609826 [Lentinus tigrinus ALCF2SS1-7]